MSLLDQLARQMPVEQSVAVIVAHPDDETLALGGTLHLFRNLLLVHVTDGAPRRLDDSTRNGFVSTCAYAQARSAELDRALALSGCSPVRHRLAIDDQDAVDTIAPIAESLRTLFQAQRVTAALTHAFEGGHPDHDAVAMAVARVGAPVYEFPLYHAGAGGDGLQSASFLPGGGPGIEMVLSATDLARKQAMLACFETQADVIGRFDPAIERLRAAPAHDFTRAPHDGPLLYEAWGWLRFAEWRARAAHERCV